MRFRQPKDAQVDIGFQRGRLVGCERAKEPHALRAVAAKYSNEIGEQRAQASRVLCRLQLRFRDALGNGVDGTRMMSLSWAERRGVAELRSTATRKWRNRSEREE